MNMEVDQEVHVTQLMVNLRQKLKTLGLPAFFTADKDKAMISKLPRYVQAPTLLAFEENVLQPWIRRGDAGVSAASSSLEST